MNPKQRFTVHPPQPADITVPMASLRSGDFFRLEKGRVPAVWLGRRRNSNVYRFKYLNHTDCSGRTYEVTGYEAQRRRVVRLVLDTAELREIRYEEMTVDDAKQLRTLKHQGDPL